MIHIVYLSRAVHPLHDHELQALLAECRENNARHDVTGVLFYSHGSIAQFIERETDVLHPLFEKIARDGRHSHVRKLVDKPIAARIFADWAFLDLFSHFSLRYATYFIQQKMKERRVALLARQLAIK